MKEVILDDICDFYNGGAWSDKEYVPSGIPVLKVTNCKTSGFQIEEVSYLPVMSAKKYAKNKLQIRDVIIATVGSHPNLKDSAAGRSCIVNSLVEGYYLNQNAVCLRTKDDEVLDQGYLGYLSQYYLFKHYIQMRGRGAANQMRIAISAIKEYKLMLPEINNQRRVSKVLSTYDNLIENNQKQIKLLEEAARRLYKEWFIDLRFPGCEGVKVVDGVPEGWRALPLTDVLDYVRGKSYTSKELAETNEGTLMANLKNIKAYGGYNRNAEKRFTGKYRPEQELQPGDVIMGVTDMTQERRIVGHVGMVPNMKEKMTFSMDLIKLVPKIGTANFIYASMYFGGYSKKISQLANGTNILHLKPDAMRGIEMIVPDGILIEAYDNYFEPIEGKIEFLQNQSNAAVQARDRLLPKLMSGEIEV